MNTVRYSYLSFAQNLLVTITRLRPSLYTITTGSAIEYMLYGQGCGHRFASSAYNRLKSFYTVRVQCTVDHVPNLFVHTHTHRGLRALIEPVLARLMENDFQKMMDFDEFFDSIRNIVRLKVKII